jgi:hypothetical protein
MIRALRMLLTVTAAAVVVGTGVVVPANAEVRPAACAGDVIPARDAFGSPNGCKMSGTDLQRCPWDEHFVIAPDRTIWHVWPGSGGWKEMPHNGRADNMWNCYINGNEQRQVEVLVYDGSVYYSYNSGGWKGWYLH